MSSEDKSRKIKKALRQGFLDGTSKLADRKCYGYDRTSNGSLVINQEEAEIVKWVFESYRDGTSLGHIANDLAKRGTPSPTGRGKWNREAISELQKLILFSLSPSADLDATLWSAFEPSESCKH